MAALELTLLLCIIANAVLFARLFEKWREFKVTERVNYDEVAAKALAKYRERLLEEVRKEYSRNTHELYTLAYNRRYTNANEPLANAVAQLEASYGAQNVRQTMSSMPTGCDQQHNKYWMDALLKIACLGCGKIKTKCMCKVL